MLNITVPSTWREPGAVLVCGEAPGAEEEKQGEGFVGSSGRVLEKMLRAAGLAREQVSLANVVKRRPPENDFGVFYETVQVGRKKVRRETEELRAWKEVLVEEIRVRKPGAIVAAGAEAMKALLGMQGIADRRGSAWRMVFADGEEGPWVVPMLHPAAILYSGQWQEVVIGSECCLKRAAWIAGQGAGWEPWGYASEVVSEGEMREHLGRIEREGGEWSLDLETIPGDGSDGSEGKGAVTVLAVASWREGQAEASVLPWPREEVWEEVRATIAKRREGLCGHNFNYDRTWLKRVGAWPGNEGSVGMDTMQTWRRLFAELPKSLDFCAMWAFGQHMPYWKDEGKRLHAKRKKTSEEQLAYWRYAGKDVVATLWLARWLRERGATPSVLDKEMWKWSAEMTDAGLPVRRESVEVLGDVARVELERAKSAIAELEPELNPASSQQVQALVYEKLGLPKQFKGKRLTADEEALKQIQLAQPTPIVGRLLRWRKLEKLVTGFIEVLSVAAWRDDQTLYCGWTAGATETWRFASANHPCGGGLNAQTVPGCLRYLVHAPPGRLFIQPDLSQAEARYVAWRARATKLMELFNDSTKSVHIERAKQLFKKEHIEKDSYEYKTAKKTVHGANYLEGPKRLALQCGMSMREAKVLLSAARAAHPEIPRWHQEVKELARTKGQLVNSFGLRRQAITALGGVLATGQVPESAWKELVAWEPQSAIPHIVYLAMLFLDRARGGDLEALRYHAHGHDSFLASVLDEDEQVEWWSKKIKEAFAVPMRVEGQELRIPVDVQVGRTWGQMTKLSEGWRERLEAMPGPEQVDPWEAIEKTLQSVAGALGEVGEEEETVNIFLE